MCLLLLKQDTFFKIYFPVPRCGIHPDYIDVCIIPGTPYLIPEFELRIP